MDYFTVATRLAKRHAADLAVADLRNRKPTKPTSEILARYIRLDSLTITPDALPRHFVARAVILDLQPTQMVPAIIRVEDAIRECHPHMHRTGWRACSDGVVVYFEA
jgi:hypothetical protein